MSERIAIKRGAMPRAPKRKPIKPAARRQQTAMIRLPISPARLRRWASSATAVLILVVAGASVWLMQLPQRIWLATAQSVGEAGFEVRHVEVSGLENMARLPVYTAALNGPSNSMLLVDLDEVRERLKLLPWVADASVARRLPDTLVIDVVERRPTALWQYKRRLAVIDRTGQVLDTQRLERFSKLPLLIGAGANTQAHALMAMLATFPEVQSRIDTATWIGERRWDIRFRTGETLALPEGYPAARRALRKFVRMEQDTGLLERGFARFDMRLPDRMIVRVSGEPGAQALPKTGTEI